MGWPANNLLYPSVCLSDMARGGSGEEKAIGASSGAHSKQSHLHQEADDSGHSISMMIFICLRDRTKMQLK